MKLKKRLAFCMVGLLTLAGSVIPTYAAVGGNKIVVSGQGVVTVTPDIATINLGVTTKDKDAQTAQTKNTTGTNAVLAVLKEMGVADKDIQTSYFSVYPDYDYRVKVVEDYRITTTENTEPEITGYTVTNSLSITVRDLSTVGAVLEKAIAAGANYGGGISFGLSDSTAYYERALALAIENAGSKGKAIGKAIGVTVSAPSEIMEMSIYYASPSYGFTNNRSYDSAFAIPVQQGTLDVTANVQVTYEY